jgi:hypothetical protein
VPEAWANPSAMPTATASCSASTYRKSDGKSCSIGSSVDPGFPNMVVMPWRRSSWKLASRTLLMVRRGRWRFLVATMDRPGLRGRAASLGHPVFSDAREVVYPYLVHATHPRRQDGTEQFRYDAVLGLLGLDVGATILTGGQHPSVMPA